MQIELCLIGFYQPTKITKTDTFLSTKLTWNQDLLVSPIVLLFVVARERIYDGNNTWFGPSAYKVKIQHTLHSPSLHSPNDGFGVSGEHGSFWRIAITVTLRKNFGIKSYKDVS